MSETRRESPSKTEKWIRRKRSADRPSGGKKRKTKSDEDFLILPENVLEDLKFKVHFVAVFCSNKSNPSSTFTPQVNWLKSHPSSPVNAATIRDFMTKTFGYRRHLLATTLTSATQILQHCPRFVDFEYGSLVSHIFDFPITMMNLYILLHSYTIPFKNADLGRFSFETSGGEQKLPERLHREIL